MENRRASKTSTGRGHAHCANRWPDVLGTVNARHAGRDLRHFFRADAAYVTSAIYARLEEAGHSSAIRLPANSDLREHNPRRLTRPVGRFSRAE